MAYVVTPQKIRKYRMVCNRCGSSDVSSVASVAWNFDEQRWEFEDYYDCGADLDYCSSCEEETEIIEQMVYVEPVSDWD
jgi:hypothetical protein